MNLQRMTQNGINALQNVELIEYNPFMDAQCTFTIPHDLLEYLYTK